VGDGGRGTEHRVVDDPARHALSQCLGVERDPVQSVYWWQRGAERGDADGQAMLGAACYLGAGVERDPSQALVWLLRATAGKSELASRFLNAARSVLTSDEIAEAERRASLPLPEPSP
jgi:uncharacterized protein